MNFSITFWEKSAPLKLPARHCLDYTLKIWNLIKPKITPNQIDILYGIPGAHFSFYNSTLLGCNRLELQIVKMSVSSADPSTPRGGLQILLTTLRITTRRPIPSCSKASGVFPSWCGQSASLPTLHFHRAIG